MVCDLRLRNNTWPDTTMRPCRTVHDEGMADVHVTRVTGCTCARALERRRRDLCRRVAKKHTGLAIRRENARDIQMRSHDDLGRRVIVTDIREEE